MKLTELLAVILMTCHLVWGKNYFESLHKSMMEAQEMLEEVAQTVNKGLNKFYESLKFVENLIDSTLEEECNYKCLGPGKQIPLANPEHIAKANGCGSIGVFFGKEDLSRPEMEECCNDHDKCYDTCGTHKDDCDKIFKKCLYNTCEVSRKEFDNLAYKKCKGGAKLLYIATSAVGCVSFKDAQHGACHCVQAKDLPRDKNEL